MNKGYMLKKNVLLALTSAALLLLAGCAGVRNSYESLLDSQADTPVITLNINEKREILVVGDGFPGWWGYYPGIISNNPEVATIACKTGRSFIPFREPGIIFGGETCYLETKKVGTAWLLMGNKYTLIPVPEATEPDELTAEVSSPSGGSRAEMKIMLKVVPAATP